MGIFHTFSRFEPNRLAVDRKLDVSMARNKSDVCTGHGDNVIIFHIYNIYNIHLYIMCAYICVYGSVSRGPTEKL